MKYINGLKTANKHVHLIGKGDRYGSTQLIILIDYKGLQILSKPGYDPYTICSSITGVVGGYNEHWGVPFNKNYRCVYLPDFYTEEQAKEEVEFIILSLESIKSNLVDREGNSDFTLIF